MLYRPYEKKLKRILPLAVLLSGVFLSMAVQPIKDKHETLHVTAATIEGIGILVIIGLMLGLKFTMKSARSEKENKSVHLNHGRPEEPVLNNPEGIYSDLMEPAEKATHPHSLNTIKM